MSDNKQTAEDERAAFGAWWPGSGFTKFRDTAQAAFQAGAEWQARAALASKPVPLMANGLTEEETSATASVSGLSSAPVQPVREPMWQPIETAPKDGWFLAFKPGTAHIVGTILDSDHPDCEFDGGVHEAWSHRYVDGVTHWMPLPAAPGITKE